MKQLLYVCTFLLIAFAAEAKTYVVQVGVNNYANNSSLSCCNNDVDSFNVVMRKHTNEVYTLKDTKATHASVMNTLFTIFSKATENDEVVFFFSGHSYNNGLCCYDTKITNNNTANGLTYKEIKSVFKSCKAKDKMFFAETYHDEATEADEINKRDSVLSQLKDINVMSFFSCRSHEKVIPPTKTSTTVSANSLFTRYLIKGMMGAADTNKDRVITIVELFKYVNKAVVKESQDKQHPAVLGTINSNMIITDWRE